MSRTDAVIEGFSFHSNQERLLYRTFSMKKAISLLLVNPWIMDFAAYNFWAEPLGLLWVGAFLKKAGAHISYIDCLTSIFQKNPEPKKNGCSKYIRTIVKKPERLKFVGRDYAVYGISEQELLARLSSLPKPDAVLVTSIMTYWYPGVRKAVDLLQAFYKVKVPVILGGIYTNLCFKHAKQHSHADIVFHDEKLSALVGAIEKVTEKRFSGVPGLESFSEYPLPLHELQIEKKFFSLLTRRGCPFTCSYCASPLLDRNFSQRNLSSVLKEITTYTEVLSTKNIAFYDDALLADAVHHIIPLLEAVADRGIRLSMHLPNGIHARFLTKHIVELFRKTGVKTIRIGLETADRTLQKKTGGKTTNEDYKRAVELLRDAGYTREEVGTYVMLGFPGQHPEDVEKTIEFVYECGGAPSLSYFSPIPGTKIWQEAAAASPFPVEEEPLFQNNSVYILGNRDFSETTVRSLKAKAIELRGMP